MEIPKPKYKIGDVVVVKSSPKVEQYFQARIEDAVCDNRKWAYWLDGQIAGIPEERILYKLD